MFPSYIEHIDTTIFQLINDQWANRIFDVIMPAIREKYFWIPLYIIISGLLIWKFRKTGIFYMIILAVNFGCSDQISSAVIKPLVNRDRPCQDSSLKEDLILRVERCGGGKSFTSSHAANTFAFACLLTLFFRKKWKWVAPLSFIWAFSISYAQIYVGLHFPLDILGGAILGCIISLILFTFAKFLMHRKTFNQLFYS